MLSVLRLKYDSGLLVFDYSIMSNKINNKRFNPKYLKKEKVNSCLSFQFSHLSLVPLSSANRQEIFSTHSCKPISYICIKPLF